jgi:hypothetical protein
MRMSRPLGLRLMPFLGCPKIPEMAEIGKGPAAFEAAWSRYFFGNPSGASEDDRLRALNQQLRFWQESERYVSKVGSTDLHHSGVLDTYREKVAKAIIEWNSDFFRELADAMDFAERRELEPLRFIFLAMRELLFRRASITEITKRDVRLLAQRWWATERLSGPNDYAHSERQRELLVAITGKASPAIEMAIKTEIENLPQQDWSKLFKKAGLQDLRADPGGQPTHGS